MSTVDVAAPLLCHQFADEMLVPIYFLLFTLFSISPSLKNIPKALEPMISISKGMNWPEIGEYPSCEKGIENSAAHPVAVSFNATCVVLKKNINK